MILPAGPLNPGKIKAMLQVNTQSQLLAAEPGKQGFPKAPSQEKKSSHIAGGLMSPQPEDRREER